MSNGNVADSDIYRLPFETGGETSDPVDRLAGLLIPDEGAPSDADEPAAETDGAAETESEAEADEESGAIPDEGATDETPPEEADANEEDTDAAEEDEAEDAEADQPETFTVHVDGQEITVDRDELLRGYTREATFTRRMQGLAEQRTAIEAERSQFQQLREQYQERINLFEQAIEANRTPEPDWATLRQEDPGEYAAQWAEHQSRQQQLALARAERDRLQQEQAAEMDRAKAQYLAEQRERLADAIPELRDPTKASTEKARMAQYAKNAYGFTDDDLSGIMDHRALVLLRKAMLWDELQTTTKPEVMKKVKAKQTPASPTLKPGSAKQPAAKNTKAITQRREQLARTGRVDDAASAIEALLDD